MATKGILNQLKERLSGIVQDYRVNPLLPLARMTAGTSLERGLSQVSQDFRRYNPVSQTVKAVQNIPKNFNALPEYVGQQATYSPTLRTAISPEAQKAVGAVTYPFTYPGRLLVGSAMSFLSQAQPQNRQLLEATQRALPFDTTQRTDMFLGNPASRSLSSR